MFAKNKSRYRPYSLKRKQFNNLEAGLSGFLCTCNSKLKKKDCVRESYSILNEFADKLFPNEENLTKNENELVEAKSDEIDDDIDKALQKEVESIKTEINKRPEDKRFQVIESGANGIVFIRTTVPDPVKLAHTIVTSSSKVQKTKCLLRLLPVEITCRAYMDDICSCCDSLFDKYFTGEKTTFAIVYNHRNNDRIRRDELIEKVAALVYKRSYKHKANLKKPKLVILIEIIRSICCISVVPDFFALKKYNLMELAAQKNENADKEESQEEKTSEEKIIGENISEEKICEERTCEENICEEKICEERTCVKNICEEKICEERTCEENICEEKICDERTCEENICEEKICDERTCEENICEEKICEERTCEEKINGEKTKD